MADPHDENSYRVVLDLADHPEVAHTIAPQSTKRTGQGMAKGTRIVLLRDTVIHEIEDALRNWLVELLKLAACGFGVLNGPRQGRLSDRRWNEFSLRPCGLVPERRQPGSSLPDRRGPFR